MTPKIIELTLTTLTYGGEAMGRHEGKAVFVPFALPGETVRARLVDERKNFARAELVEVLAPSPKRIAPRCAHFFSLPPKSGEGLGMRAACGGCHYQNLAYADQLAAKTDILRDQLTRIGKIENPPIQTIVASPVEWNYQPRVFEHIAGFPRIRSVFHINLSPPIKHDSN